MRAVNTFLILLCIILGASAFIEEAVKQLELEYSDSEDEVAIAIFCFLSWYSLLQLFPGRQVRTTSKGELDPKEEVLLVSL